MLTTTWVGVAALWIAALSFIGLGVQVPMPELDTILNDSHKADSNGRRNTRRWEVAVNIRKRRS
ncbi:hypothetical protein CO683_40790, partial [Bradyrhizobium ottawaense]